MGLFLLLAGPWNANIGRGAWLWRQSALEFRPQVVLALPSRPSPFAPLSLPPAPSRKKWKRHACFVVYPYPPFCFALPLPAALSTLPFLPYPPRYLTRPVTLPSPLPYPPRYLTFPTLPSALPHSSCYLTLPATLPTLPSPLPYLSYLTLRATSLVLLTYPPRYLTFPTVPSSLPYLSYRTLPATLPFLPYPPRYLTVSTLPSPLPYLSHLTLPATLPYPLHYLIHPATLPSPLPSFPRYLTHPATLPSLLPHPSHYRILPATLPCPLLQSPRFMKQRHSVQVAGVFVAVFVRLLTGAVRGFSDALRPQKPYALLGTRGGGGRGRGDRDWELGATSLFASSSETLWFIRRKKWRGWG